MSSKIKARATSPASFDHELAELEALSEMRKLGFSFDPEQIEHLRKALAHRNNFIVSKAAPSTSLRSSSWLAQEGLASLLSISRMSTRDVEQRTSPTV